MKQNFKRNPRTSGALALAMGLLALAPGLRAADGENYKGEVSGFVGTQRLDTINKPLFGGTFGRMVGTNPVLFFEPSYVSLGPSVRLFNGTGGLNIGIPTSNSRLVPYVSLVGGVGRFTQPGASELYPLYGGGFGIRYGFGPNWGIKPEFRWLHYQGSQGGNSYQFMAGLFYRFGSR